MADNGGSVGGKGKGKGKKRKLKEDSAAAAASSSSSSIKKSKLALQEAAKDEIEQPKKPPLAPGFNLAGRPGQLKLKEGGIKKVEIKAAGPFHTSNVNTEAYWHFVIRSSKTEWIRLRPDSVSAIVYGTYNNPAPEPANADPVVRAVKHALRAGVSLPVMWLDPSVLGTSFVDRVEVSINNVPVPTNSTLGGFLLHYVRCCNIFHHKAKDFLATTSDVDFAEGNRNKLSPAMKKAVAPFDYFSALATAGVRVPLYLNGIWPFDSKNRTLESIDLEKEHNLCFPPDTTLEIKIHVYKNKSEGLFHDNVNMVNYWAEANRDGPTGELKMAIQEVTLEYESYELKAEQHVTSMNQFLDGGLGIYDYDIIRGQHQSLGAGQASTECNFQILPFARLFYILFLPDFATFPMDVTKKPISGFSRFPEHCEGITINFGGERGLVTRRFEKFGQRGETADISKKILFQYLKDKRMINMPFSKYFPLDPTEMSIVQVLPIDVKDHVSDRTEILQLKMDFGNERSPARQQVVCLSVHPNGKATCRSGGTQFEWMWSFSVVN